MSLLAHRRNAHGLLRDRDHGFTLIELLVAVAIVAIIAGLILAALGRAKESSRRTTCVNNLRQASLAMLIYAEDSDGHVPALVFEKEVDDESESWGAVNGGGNGGGNGKWKIMVKQNKKFNAVVGNWIDRRVVLCPSDLDPETISIVDEDGSMNKVPFSYNMNFEFLVNDGQLQNLAAPQDVLLLYDGTPSHANGKYLLSKYNARYATFRHLGRVDGAYADGHVGQLQVINDGQIVLQ